MFLTRELILTTIAENMAHTYQVWIYKHNSEKDITTFCSWLAQGIINDLRNQYGKTIPESIYKDVRNFCASSYWDLYHTVPLYKAQTFNIGEHNFNCMDTDAITIMIVRDYKEGQEMPMYLGRTKTIKEENKMTELDKVMAPEKTLKDPEVVIIEQGLQNITNAESELIELLSRYSTCISSVETIGSNIVALFAE